MYYYDSWLTIILLVLGFLICIFAQIKIHSTYSKYKEIKSSSEKTGEDVAVAILNKPFTRRVWKYQYRCFSNSCT